MVDKRVDVLTRFRADSGALDRGMRRSALYAKQLNDRITAVTGSVLRMASTAASVAGFAGVGYVVAKTAKDMVQFNRELETAKISIATVLQQRSVGGKGPFENWETALKGSADTIRELERRAAALPGTTDEFRRGLELVLPLTTRAGKSINDTIGLAEKLVVQAKVGNVYGGVETVARDVQQILSGSASLAEINTIALKGRAKEIAEIARTDQSKAMREIEKVLAVGDSALKAFAGTFETQASTMQDNITRFVRTAGEPVFEWARDRLVEWNGWLTKNEAKVKAIAKTIGEGIVKGIKTAGEWAKKLYEHWDDIKAVIRTIAEVWIAGKLVSAIGKVTTAITAAGGIKGAITSLLGPIGLVIAGFETIRMLASRPNSEADEVRKRYLSGEMTSAEQLFLHATLPPAKPNIETADRAKTKAIMRMGEKRSFYHSSVDSEQLRTKVDPIIGAADERLVKAAQAYKNYQQIIWGVAGVPSVAKSALKIFQEQVGLLKEQFDAEKPPVIDARGSTFHFDQRFEEGDPERIFFEIRSALVKPFLPRLGSTLAPS